MSTAQKTDYASKVWQEHKTSFFVFIFFNQTFQQIKARRRRHSETEKKSLAITNSSDNTDAAEAAL